MQQSHVICMLHGSAVTFAQHIHKCRMVHINETNGHSNGLTERWVPCVLPTRMIACLQLHDFSCFEMKFCRSISTNKDHTVAAWQYFILFRHSFLFFFALCALTDKMTRAYASSYINIHRILNFRMFIWTNTEIQSIYLFFIDTTHFFAFLLNAWVRDALLTICLIIQYTLHYGRRNSRSIDSTKSLHNNIISCLFYCLFILLAHWESVDLLIACLTNLLLFIYFFLLTLLSNCYCF